MATKAPTTPEPVPEMMIEAQTKEVSCEQLLTTVSEIRSIDLAEIPQEKADILKAEEPVENLILTENKICKDQIENLSGKETSRGITAPVALEKLLNVEDRQKKPSSKTEPIISDLPSHEQNQQKGGPASEKLDRAVESVSDEQIGKKKSADPDVDKAVSVPEGTTDIGTAGVTESVELGACKGEISIAKNLDTEAATIRPDPKVSNYQEETMEGKEPRTVAADENIQNNEMKSKNVKESGDSLHEEKCGEPNDVIQSTEEEIRQKEDDACVAMVTEETNIQKTESENDELEQATDIALVEKSHETTETSLQGEEVEVAKIEETSLPVSEIPAVSKDDNTDKESPTGKLDELPVIQTLVKEILQKEEIKDEKPGRMIKPTPEEKKAKEIIRAENATAEIKDEKILNERPATETTAEEIQDIENLHEKVEFCLEMADAKEKIETKTSAELDSLEKNLDTEEARLEKAELENEKNEPATDIVSAEKSHETNGTGLEREEVESVKNSETPIPVSETPIFSKSDDANKENPAGKPEELPVVQALVKEILQKDEIQENKIENLSETISGDKNAEVMWTENVAADIQEENLHEVLVTETSTEENQDNKNLDEKNMELGLEIADVGQKIEIKMAEGADIVEKNLDIPYVAASEKFPSKKEEYGHANSGTETVCGESDFIASLTQQEAHCGSRIVNVKQAKASDIASEDQEVQRTAEAETSNDENFVDDNTDKKFPFSQLKSKEQVVESVHMSEKTEEPPVKQALIEGSLQKGEIQGNEPEKATESESEENAEKIIIIENAIIDIPKEELNPSETPATEVPAKEDTRDNGNSDDEAKKDGSETTVAGGKTETDIQMEEQIQKRNLEVRSVAPVAEEMSIQKEQGEKTNIIPETLSYECDFIASSPPKEVTDSDEIEYEKLPIASDAIPKDQEAETSSSVDESSVQKLQESSELKSEEREMASVHVSEMTEYQIENGTKHENLEDSCSQKGVEDEKLKEGKTGVSEYIAEGSNEELKNKSVNTTSETESKSDKIHNANESEQKEEDEKPHKAPELDTEEHTSKAMKPAEDLDREIAEEKKESDGNTISSPVLVDDKMEENLAEPVEQVSEGQDPKTTDSSSNVVIEVPKEEADHIINFVASSSVKAAEEKCSQQVDTEDTDTLYKRQDIVVNTHGRVEEILKKDRGEETESRKLKKAFDTASVDKSTETIVEAEPAKTDISEYDQSSHSNIDSPSMETSLQESTRTGAPSTGLVENTEKTCGETLATTGNSTEIEDAEGKTLEKDNDPAKNKCSEVSNHRGSSINAETSEPSSKKDISEGEKLEKIFDLTSEELEADGARGDTEKEILEKEGTSVKNIEEKFQEDRKRNESLEHEADESQHASIPATNENPNEEQNPRTVDQSEETEAEDAKGEENPNQNIANSLITNAQVEETIQEEKDEKTEISEFVHGEPRESIDAKSNTQFGNSEKGTVPEKLERDSGSVSEEKSHEGTIEISKAEAEKQISEAAALEEEKDADGATSISTLQKEKVEVVKELDSKDKLESFVDLKNQQKEVPKKDEASQILLENKRMEYDQMEEPACVVSEGLESTGQIEEMERQLIEGGKRNGTENVLARDEQVEEFLEGSEKHKVPEEATNKLESTDLSCNMDNSEIKNPCEEVSKEIEADGASENIGKQAKEKEEAIKDLDILSADETLSESILDDEKKHEESTSNLEVEEQHHEENDTSNDTKGGQNEEDKDRDLVSNKEEFRAVASTEKGEPLTSKASKDPNEIMDASSVKIALADETLGSDSEGPEETGRSVAGRKQTIKEDGTDMVANDAYVQDETVEGSQCRKLEETIPESEAEDQSFRKNDGIKILDEEVSGVAGARENVENQTAEIEDVFKYIDTSSATDVAVKEHFQQDECRNEEETPQSGAEDQCHELNHAIHPIKSGKNKEEMETTGSAETIESVTSSGDEEPNGMADALTVKTVSTENPLHTVSEELETASEVEDIQRQIDEAEDTGKGDDDISGQDEPVEETQSKKLEQVKHELAEEEQSFKTQDIIKIPKEEESEAAGAGENIERRATEEDRIVEDLHASFTTETVVKEDFHEDKHKKLQQETQQEDQLCDSNAAIDLTKSSQNEEVKASDLVSKEQEIETAGSTEMIETVISEGNKDPTEMIDAPQFNSALTENPLDTLSEGLETTSGGQALQKQRTENKESVSGVQDASIRDEPVHDGDECSKPKEAKPQLEVEAQTHHANALNDITEVSGGFEAADVGKDIGMRTMEEESSVKDLESLPAKDELVEERIQEDLEDSKKIEEGTSILEVKTSDLASKQLESETTASSEKLGTVNINSNKDPDEMVDASPVKTTSTENPFDTVTEEAETISEAEEIEKHIVEECNVKSRDGESIRGEPCQESASKLETKDQNYKTNSLTGITNLNVEVSQGLEASVGCDNTEKQINEKERAAQDIDSSFAKKVVEEIFQEEQEHNKLGEAACHLEVEERQGEVNDATHRTKDMESEEVSEGPEASVGCDNNEKQINEEERAAKDIDSSFAKEVVAESFQEEQKEHNKLGEATCHLEVEEWQGEVNDTTHTTKDTQSEEVSDGLEAFVGCDNTEKQINEEERAAKDIDSSFAKEVVAESFQEEQKEHNKLEEATCHLEVEEQQGKVAEGLETSVGCDNNEKQINEEDRAAKDIESSFAKEVVAKRFQEEQKEHSKLGEATCHLEVEERQGEVNDAIHTTKDTQSEEVSEGLEASVGCDSNEKPINEQESAAKDIDSSFAKEVVAESFQEEQEHNKLEEATCHLEVEEQQGKVSEGLEASVVCDNTEKRIKEEERAAKDINYSFAKVVEESFQEEQKEHNKLEEATCHLEVEEQQGEVSEGLEASVGCDNNEKQINEEDRTAKDIDSSFAKEVVAKSFQEEQKEHSKLGEATCHLEVEERQGEVSEGLEASVGCDSNEKPINEQESAAKDIDSSFAKEVVAESFQEEQEHNKLEEATCHLEVEEQQGEVNDATHTTKDKQSEEVSEGLEASVVCDNTEKWIKEEERVAKDIDSSVAKEVVAESFQEEQKEHNKLEEATCHLEVEVQQGVVNDATHTTKDKQSDEVEASNLASLERNIETTATTEKMEAVTSQIDENPGVFINASLLETPLVEETAQEREGNKSQEGVNFASKEDNEELKLEGEFELMSEKQDPTKMDISTDDEKTNKTVDVLPNLQASVEESTQKEAPQLESEEHIKEVNDASKRKTHGTERQQLPKPSQTASAGLEATDEGENIDNQIIKKHTVAGQDTVFFGVEAIKETIQEENNKSTKVEEDTAEMEPEGQSYETKEADDITIKGVPNEETSLGVQASDSSIDVEKRMIEEEEDPTELDVVPVGGEVLSFETKDTDDKTKNAPPDEEVEFDSASTEQNLQTTSSKKRTETIVLEDKEDSDKITDAVEATNINDDEVLNKNSDVSDIVGTSGDEILQKENTTKAYCLVPDKQNSEIIDENDLAEAAIQQTEAEEISLEEETGREQLKEEITDETKEETLKYEENQHKGLGSSPISKASVVEIFQSKGEKSDKAFDLVSQDKIKETTGANNVGEIHIPMPEEVTDISATENARGKKRTPEDELQDPKKLEHTTRAMLEEQDHEKIHSRETAEIAVEKEDKSQNNINGLSNIYTSEEGSNTQVEALSHEMVAIISNRDQERTAAITPESKDKIEKFVIVPDPVSDMKIHATIQDSEGMESATLKSGESLNKSFDVLSLPHASGEEISQKEGDVKHAGFKEVLQDNYSKDTTLYSCEPIEKSSEKASVEEQKIGDALQVESNLKRANFDAEKQDETAEKGMETATDLIEESDSGKVRLSDLLERSKRENMQMAEDFMQETHPAVVEDDVQNKQVATDHLEEEKTDEEEDDDEHKKDESGSDAPVMVEAVRDVDLKPAHKKSHNILSGVGSKVKHSIAKVKKAITGKSNHPKSLSAK